MKYSLDDFGLVDASPDATLNKLTKLSASLVKNLLSLVSIVDFKNNWRFFKTSKNLQNDRLNYSKRHRLIHSAITLSTITLLQLLEMLRTTNK